jgi:predicted RNase H-like HicB family nuclease
MLVGMRKIGQKIMFPVVFGKEGKWYVASCPILDIATQGATEKEARENIKDLIREYLTDKDTPKPNYANFSFPSLSYVEVVTSGE